MKTVLLSCVLLLTLIACSSDNGKETDANTPKTGPVYTLIFLDKSVSVNANKAFIAQKYQSAVNDIIEQNIKNKGDKLDVYFIHENTSKARALSVTTRSEMEDISSANATDREAAQTSFDLSLGREKATIRQRVLQQLATPNASSSNQETDIWASLPVIAKASETGATVKVYYLSDMVESVYRTGRRDFHKTPPKDNAQAETWAKSDVEQLKRYVIGNPDVSMVLPFAPDASVKENNPAVTQYWQTLFQELGAGNVEEQ